jgi:hypothetical protein
MASDANLREKGTNMYVADIIREHLVEKRAETLDGITGTMFKLDDVLPKDVLKRIASYDGIRVYTTANLDAPRLKSTAVFIADGTPLC